MLLARSLRIAFLALLSLHLIGAFAAIALLGRMRPALEQILERNVVSLEAVENMLLVLSRQAGEPAEPEAAERFRSALAIAESNVTEAEEPAALSLIRERSDQALAGEPRAIVAVTDAASQLARSNRAAIEEANRDAQALGFGGAWAVALLSFVTFAAGLMSLRLLDRRVLAPLGELFHVLGAPREGDAYRRCRPMPAAAAELTAGMRSLNELIDELTARRTREHVSSEGGGGVERATLLALLDSHPGAVVIVDDSGDIVAANALALERLAGDDGPDTRRRLRAAATESEPVDGIDTRPIPDAAEAQRRVICRLD